MAQGRLDFSDAPVSREPCARGVDTNVEYAALWHFHRTLSRNIFPSHDYFSRLASRSRKALPMTLTEESAMAAAAIMGDSSSPKTG